ncbi:unnamed protein product [Dicrocoelium dendriticum]|nr:unnamed protein product [Dicrocoelium dendriticum]
MYSPLRQKILDFVSVLRATDISAQDLLLALADPVDACQTLKQTNTRNEDFYLDASVFLETFNALKRCYILCRTLRPAEEVRKLLLSRIYELQSVTYVLSVYNFQYFIERLMYDGCFCFTYDEWMGREKLPVLLMNAANAADLIDPRLSLPMWKIASTFIYQYKNELKSCADFLDNVLIIIHNSAQHFLQDWVRISQTSKENIRSTEINSNVNPNQKMLNLLCRIATFCVREFAAVALKQTHKTESGLFTWLIWLVSTRYSSGLKVPESTFPSCMLPHLETSLFLSLDVLLDHLCTLPTSMDRNTRSVVTDRFRLVPMEPSVRLRLYSGILARLSRHPRCYAEWICADFNLYEEYIEASIQLRIFEPTDESEDLVRSYVDEFYATSLQQICASICGLPANCFFFLEKALMKGLLSNHPWTSLLSADIWCFVARYGTGDLCWQYAILFASTIQREAMHLNSSKLTDDHTKHSQVITQLDVLGCLLARFLVFLTPKQQVHFLCKYPLTHTSLLSSPEISMEMSSSLLWRFVPLPTSHLQLNTRSLIETQLSNRLSSILPLEKAGRAEDDMAVQLATETALALRLVDCQSSNWLATNASTVSAVARHSLTCFTVVSSAPVHPRLIPCSHSLLDAVRRPLCAFSHHLAMWIIQLTPSLQLVDPLLQWLATGTLTVCRGNRSMSPLSSFVALQAWHSWVSDLRAPIQSSNAWPQVIFSALSALPSVEMAPFCRTICNSLREMLVELNHGSSPEADSACGNLEITSHIDQMTDAFNRLESLFSHSSIRPSLVEIDAIHSLSVRITQFLTLLSESHQR